MIKFFNEMFFEDSSFFWKILGVLCLIISAVLIVLLLYIAYIVIDGSSSKVRQDNGIVYYGVFVPEHTSIIVMSSGKNTVPVPVHHDDAWYLDVSVADGCGRVSVGKDFYDSVDVNDSVMIQYTRGVFTKSNIYITYIEKLKK